MSISHTSVLYQNGSDLEFSRWRWILLSSVLSFFIIIIVFAFFLVVKCNCCLVADLSRAVLIFSMKVLWRCSTYILRQYLTSLSGVLHILILKSDPVCSCSQLWVWKLVRCGSLFLGHCQCQPGYCIETVTLCLCRFVGLKYRAEKQTYSGINPIPATTLSLGNYYYCYFVFRTVHF